MSRITGQLKTVPGGAQPLTPGLYIVSTPIGNLQDMTLRAIDVLSRADEVLAEDTRHARRLMDHHGIRAKLSPYHDHNGARRRPELLGKLREDACLALISDAGTPLVSDPGWKLVHDVLEAGLKVIPVPGASALLAGLVASGLPSDRFMFCGFLPSKSGARQRALGEIASVPATLVYYESAQRLVATLQDMQAVLGDGRDAAVVRELTKLFEESRRGSLAELAEQYRLSGPPKGEIVIVVGPPLAVERDAEQIDADLRQALDSQPVKQAANAIAAKYNLPKREMYQRALSFKHDQD